MRVSRITVLLSVVVVSVFAVAASVYAAPGSGPVYGQATMSPTYSITVSGGGTDSLAPLLYYGERGYVDVPEWFASQIMVENSGDAAVGLWVHADGAPSNGTNTWAFGTTAGVDTCVWRIGGKAVGSTNEQIQVSLDPGATAAFTTTLDYPTNYSAGTFGMSALITCVN